MESIITSEGLNLLGIFLTHGHFDHFYGLTNWDKKAMPPIFCPSLDMDAFPNPDKNVSAMFLGKGLRFDINAYPLEDEDEVRLGSFIIKVIATPYHTSGSSCFYVKEANALFSGDSLFAGGYGRSDFPSGDPSLMPESLNKLSKLPKDTVVYPGHGPKTTIKDEFGTK